MHSCSIFGRKQVGSGIFDGDGVGLGLLVSLAKIVAVDGRRKTEADDETQERNGPVDLPPISAQLIL